MQTLGAACSKAEPKIFAPPQTPFPGGGGGAASQGRQNLISWRWSLPSPTDPVWWRSMHAISSYHGNRPTNKQIHTQRGLITIHCDAKLSVQCKYCNSVIKTSMFSRKGNNKNSRNRCRLTLSLLFFILPNMDLKLLSGTFTFCKVVKQKIWGGLLHRPFLNSTVKILWNLVHICRGYRKNKNCLLFSETWG